MTWWESDDGDPDSWRGQLARPAVLLLAACGCAAGALALVIWSTSDVGRAIAMSRAPICSTASPAAADRSCLEVRGLDDLSGRVGHLTLTQIWNVRPADGGDDQVVDLSAAAAHRLNHEKALGPVDGLFWHGDLVAFRGQDGVVVHDDDFGPSGWLQQLPWACTLSGIGLGALASLVARRQAGVGWWERRAADPGSEFVRVTGLSWALILVGVVVGIPLQIGLPAWVSGALALVGLALAARQMQRSRRQAEHPGRHVAEP